MRLTLIAFVIALCVAPVAAQRHGGHGGYRGGGFHGGGFQGGGARHGGSSVGFGGHAGFRGSHYGGGYYAGSRHYGGYGRYYGGHRYWGGYRPRYYYPGYSGWGWGVGFYWNSYPYYYPYYYGGYVYSDPYYAYPYRRIYYVERDSDYQSDRVSRQLDDLSSEVRQLKDQNEQLRSDLQRQRASESGGQSQEPSLRARPNGVIERSPVEPPVALIFNDGRRIETRSYAISGETLWILSSDRAQKVALADLDLEKTQRVNTGRGVDFAANLRSR